MADDATAPAGPVPGPSAMPASYGLGTWDPSIPRDWPAVVAKIAGARNYWIASTGPGVRPHVAPVWGLWFEGAFCFSTGVGSRKQRNLAASPEVTVHLESGDDVVILEGTVETISDSAALDRFVDAYDAKYGVRPDPADPADPADPDDHVGVYLRLRPRVALTWEERDFVESAVRWRFRAAR